MSAPLVIVAGQARCGTSLTMQMLAAGGAPVLGEAPGYEVDQTLQMPINLAWLRSIRGHAVKVIDPHRFTPPLCGIDGATIWLDRDYTEQAKSALKLLAAIGLPVNQSRAETRRMAASLRASRDRSMRCAGVGDRPSLSLRFEDMVGNPLVAARKIAALLAPWWALDVTRMVTVARPRPPTCLPYLLELDLIEARAKP